MILKYNQQQDINRLFGCLSGADQALSLENANDADYLFYVGKPEAETKFRSKNFRRLNLT